MIDLNYKRPAKPQKMEPEEIAVCIIGTVVLLANVVAFMVAL